jgi:hypothetical protein
MKRKITKYIIRLTYSSAVEISKLEVTKHASYKETEGYVNLTTVLLSYLKFLNFLISNYSSIFLRKLLRLSGIDAVPLEI